MGMYTEFFFRAELKRDSPAEIIEWFRHTLDPEKPYLSMVPFDDHSFFQCERWRSVFWSSSAYFPTGKSAFYSGEGAYDDPHFTIHSSLKNYGGEIEEFVEWVSPFIDASDGDFLGYSLYEDSRASGWGAEEPIDQPQLIFMEKAKP